MALEGQAEVLRALEGRIRRMEQQAAAAADESALLLASWARNHHGNTPRKAGYVYPGGGKWKVKRNVYNRGMDKLSRASVWQATKRWRPAGKGWGDVTGNLNNSTQGYVQKVPGGFRIILSAGMEYAPYVELRHGGKWAWLWAAVVANQKRIVGIFRKHLEL